MSIVKGTKEFDKAPTVNGSEVLTISSVLNDLGNVSVPSPSVDDVLVWNGSAWVPATPAATPVFGDDFSETSSDSEGSTTSTSYVQRLRLTTPSLDIAGKYRINWYCELRASSTSYDVKGRVQIADSTDLALINIEPQDGNSWFPWSGFIYRTGLSGNYGVDLDYCSESSDGTAYIRRARLEIWRVS